MRSRLSSVRGREAVTAKLFLTFVAACALATAGGTAPSDPESRDQTATLVSGGFTRSSEIHLPPAYDAKTPFPLVLVLHGRLGDGRGMRRISHFDQVADRHGFLVVFPDGYQKSWADGGSPGPAERANVDDVAFIGALLDRLKKDFRVDTRRLYVTGLSNGGYMSGRLACDLASRLAAAAPVAALITDQVAVNCHPSRPIPILYFLGTADPLVPYARGATHSFARRTVLFAGNTLAMWRKLDACDSASLTDDLPHPSGDSTHTTRTVWSSCRGTSEVVLLTVHGGGHAWPGGVPYLPESVIGRTSSDFDASELIWQFFSRHSL